MQLMEGEKQAMAYLAEELIAAQAAEPGDPTHFLGTGHLALGRRIGRHTEHGGDTTAPPSTVRGSHKNKLSASSRNKTISASLDITK
jgi:hypothetical protein